MTVSASSGLHTARGSECAGHAAPPAPTLPAAALAGSKAALAAFFARMHLGGTLCACARTHTRTRTHLGVRSCSCCFMATRSANTSRSRRFRARIWLPLRPAAAAVGRAGHKQRVRRVGPRPQPCWRAHRRMRAHRHTSTRAPTTSLAPAGALGPWCLLQGRLLQRPLLGRALLLAAAHWMLRQAGRAGPPGHSWPLRPQAARAAHARPSCRCSCRRHCRPRHQAARHCSCLCCPRRRCLRCRGMR